MKQRTSTRNITGLIISALLFALTLLPASTFAATPAGTVITNIATVTWGGTNSASSPAVTVTVLLAETTPILEWVTTEDSTPTVTSTVPESEAMTITYNVTSQANGFDTYNLASTITSVPALSDPAAVTVFPASIDLGATSVVSISEPGDGTTVITVGSPSTSGSGGHGLVAGTSTVVINTATGTTYPVVGVADGATNTITITGTSLGLNAGDLIVEQKQFTVTFTTGIIQLGLSTGTHPVVTTAQDDGAIPQTAATIATATDDDVIVVKAALTLAKTANGGNTANVVPGATVIYSMTATNGGSSDAASVVITDQIQNFTTFAGGLTTTPAADLVEYSVDDGVTYGTLPGDITTVTHVEATWNTLSSVAPNNTANLTFEVTVD